MPKGKKKAALVALRKLGRGEVKKLLEEKASGRAKGKKWGQLESEWWYIAKLKETFLMIIKKMDSKREEIRQLEALLKGRLTSYRRFLIERELKAMRSGVHGEEDSAYYIDFYFGNSKNWAIIHDIRLEHRGQVAQIDHVLINRFFDMYVLESKNYSYKLKISPEGEFQVYYGKEYVGIPSPIEQNKRHIHLLDLFLKSHNILPKRMRIPIRPRFKNIILVSPKCIITRPPKSKFDASSVIKADTLRTTIDVEVDKGKNPFVDLAVLSEICSPSTLESTAKRLAAYHKPLKIDFRARFGLSTKGFSNPQSERESKVKKTTHGLLEMVGVEEG